MFMFIWKLYNVLSLWAEILSHSLVHRNSELIKNFDIWTYSLCIHAYFTQNDIQLKIKLSGFMRIFLNFKSKSSYITVFQRWETRVSNKFSWTSINFLLCMGKFLVVLGRKVSLITSNQTMVKSTKWHESLTQNMVKLS